MPLIATTRPARSASTMSSTGTDILGPHAGQAVGWAWKRREAGSSYSCWQASHSGKSAMVVPGRSYGRPVTMVKRGPQ